MDRNMKLLEAAMTQLRGKALEHLATVEILLDNPRATGDHTNYVDQIVSSMREAMICENSLNALQMYFVPKQEAPEPPQAREAPIPGKK